MTTAAFAASVLLLAGCGESDPGGAAEGGDTADEATQEAIDLMDEGKVATETGEEEVVVDAVDNNFKPKYIEVSKGTAVRFVNEGRNIHNVLPVQEGAFEPIEKLVQGAQALASAREASWATAQTRSPGIVLPASSVTAARASRPWLLIGCRQRLETAPLISWSTWPSC